MSVVTNVEQLGRIVVLDGNTTLEAESLIDQFRVQDLKIGTQGNLRSIIRTKFKFEFLQDEQRQEIWLIKPTQS